MFSHPTPMKLEAPPIIEVMCGFFFPPIPDLDPVAVGGWWRQIRDVYPKHMIQPAVIETPGVMVTRGAGFLRSWLISEDDSWVLQVQADRFYVNWRRRTEEEYPRFSGDTGVGERALAELARFRAYCAAELKTELAPAAVELAKVDLIAEGTHWDGADDLGTVLPIVADLRKFAKSSDLEVGLNFIEPRPTGRLQVSLSLSTETMLDRTWARAVKIDSRCMMTLTSPSDSDVRAAFAKLNADLNDVFFGLITPAELTRFTTRKGAS